MARGIKRRIARALKRLAERNAAQLKGAGHVQRGLSTEGYEGGYAKALMDVELLLNGVTPSRSEWQEDE